MSEAPATFLVDYATAAIKTDSHLCNLGVISRRPTASPEACFHIHTREPLSVPPGTQWTSTSPDDSSSPRERRTDSLDERTLMNVTTAERKAFFNGMPQPKKIRLPWKKPYRAAEARFEEETEEEP